MRLPAFCPPVVASCLEAKFRQQQLPSSRKQVLSRFRCRLLFFLIFLSEGAVWAEWHPVWRGGRRYVPLEDVADFYGLSAPVVDGRSFSLTSPKRTLRGTSGSRELFINNVKYILCFPVQSDGKRLFLTSMDLLKIVEPVMRPQKIQNTELVKTVVLDAGHGGYDSGASCSRGPEKEFTLDTVLRVARLLKQRGYQVRLTRRLDTFVPLGDRVAIANSIPNSVFISVHFNQSRGGTARGVETYCVAPLGVPSMEEEFVTYRDLKPCAGQQQDPQNIALATAVHAAVIQGGLGVADRGIKRARYLVIRDLRIPGVLLEGGFLSDASDAQRIASPDYREQLAERIARAVDNYRQAIERRGPLLGVKAQKAPQVTALSLRDERALLRIVAPTLDPDLPGLLPPLPPRF